MEWDGFFETESLGWCPDKHQLDLETLYQEFKKRFLEEIKNESAKLQNQIKEPKDEENS